ncbi:exodeoxyribonuclease III [Enterobacter cancerogenus ATCC 35316]|nr:exodeoxyribonuclease III [Enterobacter cancerogenus ATCC 35316]
MNIFTQSGIRRYENQKEYAEAKYNSGIVIAREISRPFAPCIRAMRLRMVQKLHRREPLSQLLVKPDNSGPKFCYHPCTIHLALAATMKFVSFNINGLRARPHQLEAIVEQHQPDVIGLQETKVHDDMFPLEEVAKLGYNVFYHGQKGHYGVALLTKETPVSVRRGFPGDDGEAQRRIIMAEIPSPLGNITVINGYFPQGESRDHPTKFPAKAKFYQDLQDYLTAELNKENPVLIMGDVNISPTDLDIGIGEESRKRWLRTGKCSFLPEEREWMERLIGWGLVDTFRAANPDTQDRFSWFDYRSKGFDDNRGLRIDLLLASAPLAERCIETGIDYDIRGMEKPSDHAPVWAKFKL